MLPVTNQAVCNIEPGEGGEHGWRGVGVQVCSVGPLVRGGRSRPGPRCCNCRVGGWADAKQRAMCVDTAGPMRRSV
eukprot:11513234-Alexandrium_andersonii.AAC.1